MPISNSENIYNKYANMAANSNVQFLAGSQASLNALMDSGADASQEGAFYLTNDTHRLYIGRKITGTGGNADKIVPVPVNEGITTVKNITTLETVTEANVGDFYYVEDENILAVCSSVSSSSGSRTCTWVQMNANTSVRNFTQKVTATTVGDNKSAAIITSQIVQSPGAPDREANFSVVSGSNVTITVSGSAITFAATDTTYTMSNQTNTTTHQAELTLTPNSGNAQAVALTSSDSSISINAGAAGTIDFTGINDIAATAIAATETTNGGWAINLKKGNDTFGIGASIAPIIAYGSGSTIATKSKAKFSDGTASLDVYTRTEADTAISNAIQNALTDYDAMKFMGTVSGDSSNTDYFNTVLTNNGLHNGDVYKVSTTATYTGSFTSRLEPAGYTSWRTGDMIIVGGRELNGVIPTDSTSDLTFYVIPAGNEAGFVGFIAATATGTHAANSIELWENAVDSGAEVIGFNLASGTDNKVIIATTASGNNHATMTLSHNTVNRNNTAASELDNSNANTSLEFYAPVVDRTNGFGITTDSTGHVTGVTMAKVTVTHNKLSTIRSVFGAVTNESSATLTQTFADDINTQKSTTVQLQSSTINFTATGTNNTVTMNIQWGTF